MNHLNCEKDKMQKAIVSMFLPVLIIFGVTSVRAAATEIELYMADPEVRIAQKIYCQLRDIEPSDRLRAVLDGRVLFEKGGNLQSEEIFVADYRNQSAGDHTLLVQILDAAGIEKASATKNWTTLHNGIPTVGIDENNAIRVNGELVFPIYPATAEVYINEWISHGLANTGSDMNFLHGNYSEYTKEEYKDWLDRCANMGIRNIGPAARWAGIGNLPHGKGNDLDKMREYVEYLRQHPGVLMWQWSDEPDGGGSGNQAEPDEVRSWSDLCHRFDTNHPHAVNLTAYAWARDGAWYLDHCKDYSYLFGSHWHDGGKKLLGDVIGFDFYPIEYATKIPHEFGDLEVSFATMAKALDRIREYNHDLAPIFSWNENCDIHPDRDGNGFADGPGSPYAQTEAPTADEMWAEYWIKVIHGVKGFKIHTAFDSDCRGFDQFTNGGPPANHETMARFVNWMNDLKFAVLGPDYAGPVITVEKTGGGRVDAMMKEYKGEVYIFAANLRRESAATRFVIPGLPSGTTVRVYGEERSILSETGFFADSFGSLGVHIYTLLAPPQQLRIIH